MLLFSISITLIEHNKCPVCQNKLIRAGGCTECITGDWAKYRIMEDGERIVVRNDKILTRSEVKSDGCRRKTSESVN